jgi:HSP20 family protein
MKEKMHERSRIMGPKFKTPGNKRETVKRNYGEHQAMLLKRAVNALFDDFFMSYELAPLSSFEDFCLFNPQINMSDNGKELKVTVELPGMDKDDIEISLDQHTLTIKGNKKGADEGDRTSYCMERVFGEFKRVIPIPPGIDPERAEAAFRKGVLTIIMPKLAAFRNEKKIPIKKL